MPNPILFLVFLFVCTSSRADVIITPSEVYGQVLLIEKETELVKRHFHAVKQPSPVTEIVAELTPRHIWQKGYMLQMKLVAFRRKQQMDGLAPVVIEPRKDVDPRYTWAQAQRILTEIRIIRKTLGIPGDVGEAPLVEGKKPLDVFNKLAQLEAEWDALTGAGFDASYAFAQVLRLSEDVDMILRQLGLFDNAIPPAKKPTDTPVESLAQTFLVLQQVQRLQKIAGLEVSDLSVFHKQEQATPADVFNMVCLIIGEIQQIKDVVGLKYAITIPATHYEDKTPAEVSQFLGYITNKLSLIQHL